jgi:hypothetical protein
VGLVALAALIVPLWPLVNDLFLATCEGGTRLVTPAFRWALTWHGTVLTYGFLSALSAPWTGGSQNLTRAKHKAYALAVGKRDAGLTFSIFGAQLLALVGVDLTAVLDGLASGPIALVLFVSGPTLVFILLLAYGMLATQLFVVDLRIKHGLRRAGVVGGFVFVFFAVSEGIETVLEGRVGEWAGLVAAGVLAFLIQPMERAAEEIADSVMPGVEDTQAYREERRREIYEATLADLLADGDLSDREPASSPASASASASTRPRPVRSRPTCARRSGSTTVG